MAFDVLLQSVQGDRGENIVIDITSVSKPMQIYPIFPVSTMIQGWGRLLSRKAFIRVARLVLGIQTPSTVHTILLRPQRHQNRARCYLPFVALYRQSDLLQIPMEQEKLDVQKIKE